MNIQIIATGGTIGSRFDGDVVRLSEGTPEVAERYTREHGTAFDVRSPLHLLSERITPDDFSALARAVYDVDREQLDGVIITCGSDTIAYIAGFVGLLFGSDSYPLMIVASNRVLSDVSSNGYENFCCAIKLIEAGVCGALVPYRNTDGVMYVHEATALRSADLCDNLHSLYDDVYAVYDGGLCERRRYHSEHIPNGVFSSLHPPVLQHKALLLHPYPGFDPATVNLEGMDAVLHTLYHSSTLDPVALDGLLERSDVPMFLSSFRSGRKVYETAAHAIDRGAVPLYDIAPECAYMKLLLSVNQDVMPITQFMIG